MILNDKEGENENEDDKSRSSQIYSDSFKDSKLHKITHIQNMFQNWWIDYASYVILQRAVPEISDGLKPVQRRILHSMKELDDGRYNKVANLIGNTMKYHPHGDRSIGDAMVQLGQKDLLIDTQGNWGNILTGDSAAAPRYIEARLSKFALEVAFNSKTTTWKSSYDGRNDEPTMLPVKFPLLLAQGVEGIAVGLASKILPHNFIELIDASINYLQNKDFILYPDFQTGGLIDISKYNDGARNGKVRIRAKINQLDKKTLSITEIPFSNTTTSLIDSILLANDKGKIKIKKIDDNTSENVEILIHLAPNISPDQTIDALYAFTNCEISLSPNPCVIENNKPIFPTVSELLKISADRTLNLLKRELEIKLNELNEHWHFASLEKIFIENRIYNSIEDCETWESVLETIDKGLEPFKKIFQREIVIDDIIRLTEIKIKRISKFDSFKADEIIKGIDENILETKNHLENLIDFAINYFKQIKKKYSKGKERKTEIKNFENIEAQLVAVANQKLFVNKKDGFIGYNLKKDDNAEYVCDCSDIDDIIVFREDGKFIVSKISEKTFVGQNIIHTDVFKRNDDRTVYHLIYSDGLYGNSMVKRFTISGITRDKEYDLTKGAKGSKVIYFTANPNGEAEKIKIILKPKPKLKKLIFEYDFGQLSIKGRSSIGNIISRNPIKRIDFISKGDSTLSDLELWFDESVNRLNTENRGKSLGYFSPSNKIISIFQNGYYKTNSFDLTLHFENDLICIEKFKKSKPITIIYQDLENDKYFIKRFNPEISDKKVDFFSEPNKIKIFAITNEYLPQIEIQHFNKNNEIVKEIINISEFVEVMNIKAKGKRLNYNNIKKFVLLEPLPFQENEQDYEIEENIIFDEQEIEELWNKSNDDIKNILPKNDNNNDKDPQITLF